MFLFRCDGACQSNKSNDNIDSGAAVYLQNRSWHFVTLIVVMFNELQYCLLMTLLCGLMCLSL